LGKPVESRGRKASDLRYADERTKVAGLPVLACFTNTVRAQPFSIPES